MVASRTYLNDGHSRLLRNIKRVHRESFSQSLSVCETVIGSAGDEAFLSLATSVTSAASTMPASFFVPWKVLEVYRFRPLPSVPTKAWSRQDDGPRCCMCPGVAAPFHSNTEGANQIASADCQSSCLDGQHCEKSHLTR
jgi:hypothetical protein